MSSEHTPASAHVPESAHLPESEHLPASPHVPAADTLDQRTDSDVCEELVSSSNGDERSCVAVDAHSQRLSDARENVVATSGASSSRRQLSATSSSILSHKDQSKLDHSVISSSLKNISQNEDQGLVYIAFSKPGSTYVLITAAL